MNNAYGIVFNKEEYVTYIHSIPSSLILRRDKMAKYPMENTQQVMVLSNPKHQDEIKILSITDKSFRVHSLTYSYPTFQCVPSN